MSVSELVGLDELRERVRRGWEDLPPSCRRVGATLAAAPVERLLHASTQSLGDESGSSGATVVRTLQVLGYAGLPDLKNRLVQAHSNGTPPQERLRARLRRGTGGISELSDEIVTETLERVRATRAGLDDAVVMKACELLAGADCVHTYGVGLSRVAADFLAVKLGRLGVATRHMAAEGFGLADELLRVRPGSVLVVFAPGRMVRDIEVMFDRAGEVGAGSVLITSDLQDSPAIRSSVTLSEASSSSGMTHEVLTALMICDLLLQVVAQADEDTAVDRSEQLTSLRSRLGFR